MASPDKKDAYVTLLLNDAYLPGALVLGHSLRDAGTSKQLVALVTPDSVSEAVITELKTVYDEIISVPRVQNSATPDNLELMERPDLHSAFTKIHLWNLSQFRKIVYIDADVIAYRAPDELFDLPYPFAAAPDIGWPDLFNSGVMVLTPNAEEYATFTSMAGRGISFDGADQGLFNMHFGSFHRLPFTYNVTPSAHYQYLPAYRHFQSQITMVHFIGPSKPWFEGRDIPSGGPAYDEMVGHWWSVYDKHYLKKTSPAQPEEPAGQQPPELVQYFVKGEFQPTFTHKLTADEPSLDLGSSSYDQVQRQQEGTHPPPAEPPKEPSWDAQWQPPPANAKPEAMNFPQAHYEMSRDTTPFKPPERYPSPPRDMWFEVPKEAPVSVHQRPPPIFPWEGHQPAATRVFAEPPPAPAPASTHPAHWVSHAHHASGTEPPMTADTSSVDGQNEPSTPPTTRAAPPSDPWASFTRTNAWDDVPQIERYVDTFQKQHRFMRSRSRGSLGGVGEDAELSSSFQRRGSKITDFPSEVERPSLPVTPAPVRRPKFWVGGEPGFGDGGDAEGAAHPLPAAKGVPQQVDWDPVAQLQKLAQAQSELLLKKLGHSEEGSRVEDETEIATGEATSAGIQGPAEAVAPVVSPRPVKPGGQDTRSVRSIYNSGEGGEAFSQRIQEPAYSGPGLSFDKDETFPQHEWPSLPTEEEVEILDS